jgi:hypothetical protein
MKRPADEQTISYLSSVARENGAVMRVVFSDDVTADMKALIRHYGCSKVVTGMPGGYDSPLYTLWKEFPDVDFVTVDTFGRLIEVDNKIKLTA